MSEPSDSNRLAIPPLVPPPTPPIENLPISLKNVSYSFPGLAGVTKLTLATITLYPGFQESPDKIQRNWNFMIQGSIQATKKINAFLLQFDLSKVKPDLDIDFGGLVHGTLQIGRKILPSDRHVSFSADNKTNLIQLFFQLPCFKRTITFFLNASIADDIQSSQACTGYATQCTDGGGKIVPISAGNCQICNALSGAPIVFGNVLDNPPSGYRKGQFISAFYQNSRWNCTDFTQSDCSNTNNF